jgi:hypothetical protein
MRPAIDKLRSVLVALTCDQHSSAALLREALAELELEEANQRAFGAALRTRIVQTEEATTIRTKRGTK